MVASTFDPGVESEFEITMNSTHSEFSCTLLPPEGEGLIYQVTQLQNLFKFFCRFLVINGQNQTVEELKTI